MTASRYGLLLLLLCGWIVVSPQDLRAEEAAAVDVAAHPALRTHLLLNGDQLEALLGDEALVLLHIGHGRKAYDARGHLPGAVFVDIDTLLDETAELPDRQPSRDELIAWARSVGIDGDPAQRIVLYGEASGLFAARVYATLTTLGLAERTAMLDGHLRRWIAEGRPIETGPVEATPSEWAPAWTETLEVRFGQVHTGRSVPGWTLVDARQPRYYRGEQIGRPELKEAGHVPGAVNVHWQDMVASIRDPVLKPADALREMYAEVDAGKTVAAYCATGMQSSYTFFVLRYLGYDAVWYDGSLVDWQARGGETARLE